MNSDCDSSGKDRAGYQLIPRGDFKRYVNCSLYYVPIKVPRWPVSQQTLERWNAYRPQARFYQWVPDPSQQRFRKAKQETQTEVWLFASAAAAAQPHAAFGQGAPQQGFFGCAVRPKGPIQEFAPAP